eukprot:CAMPEP_0175309176 /NCGR_PEP_ID=MMETSP0093-20121207/65668_1 /TAXON_ID=311494 /ORGANISM="Alexandrium monilatum, Strain CCMP3105" /LENGTH=76 /DNA_ID=CAMNT_0016605713 /DNA_START=42 /DNA_END=268 /DNA_ORIENTATION=+
MPDAKPKSESNCSMYQSNSPISVLNAVLMLAPTELNWTRSPPNRMFPDMAKPTKTAAKTTAQWNMSSPAMARVLVT